ncbi:MAG: oxidoreductase [Alteromonadaceae bacterium]|nr:MAG: oxidoreductase [Alteromonadaceae bacterium]
MIGFGFAAQTFHLPFVAASTVFRLVAVSSRQPELVRQSAAKLGIYNLDVFGDAEEMLQSSNADLVIITAPNAYHYPLAKASLLASKHVLIEKPMVTTSEQARDLFDLAKQTQLQLCVFQNRRWDGDFLTVKALIDHGKLGSIRLYESHFDRFRPNVRQRWREQPGEGTGIWYDLGPHLLDQALCLFGKPEAITTRLLSQREIDGACDYAHCQLHYGNREVILHASLFNSASNLKFHVQGTEGSYLKYGLDPQESQLKSGRLPGTEGFGLEDEADFGTLYQAQNPDDISSVKVPTKPGDYRAIYHHLAMAITGQKPFPVTPEEAILLVQLLELGEQSSREGKTIPCL